VTGHPAVVCAGGRRDGIADQAGARAECPVAGTHRVRVRAQDDDHHEARKTFEQQGAPLVRRSPVAGHDDDVGERQQRSP
jgi:hypothetical protein